MYELYKYNKESKAAFQDRQLNKNNNLRLSVRKISLLNMTKSNHFIYDLYWFINTMGNCWVYSVFDNSKEVHYSYATKQCYKFPFMGKHDLQIGNCFTDENYRGYGIYPYVIQKAVQQHLTNNPKGDVYMLIEQSNIASQKGVEKVGFVKSSKLIIRRLFGIFKLYEVND